MENIPGNNLPRVKVANQAAIRRMIYEYGPITRAGIAEKLSLTLPTITTNISSMIASGLLEELPAKEGSSLSLGRRANAVNIVSNAGYFIGVEFRRLFRHLCITNYRGEVIYSEVDNTDYTDYNECMDHTCRMIHKVLHSDLVPEEKLCGIGICLPGIIDPVSGTLGAHRQNNWYNKDILSDVKRLTGFKGPISVENNTLARAYGAQLFRKDLLRDIPSFTYMYIFSGIACPLILNNSTMLSNPVGPGEVGYMIIDPSKPRNELGSMGTLHSLAGERSIADQCFEALKEGNAPVLETICGGIVRPTFPQIVQAQKDGDPFCDELLLSAAYYLGIAVANVDNLIRPHSMLIEGRIFSNPKNKEHFLNTIRENQFRLSDTKTQLIFIDYDDFSGAKGAAAVAIRANLEQYIK
ncbi:ROK family transcriptional regulator [Clostridium sp. MCC353]|uniref:ROK family transcriptional regulator n=1 Tax=Clostridium sp. MCC353 TaxID=2592646 RepID=UPI001C029208|nr:ROK family transcriptional regulator [Clostridium sp. MCC353]